VLTQVLIQNIAVACIVSACVAYSSWTLMPASWRRVLASQLMRSQALAQSSALKRASSPASTGSCGGCDSCGSDKAGNTKITVPKESVIHFMPRKNR
jgi:hypothetical protein